METVKSPAEHRIVLHNTSWETYKRLLEERGESRVPRFAYDRGELEITGPSTEHESVAYYIGLLVAVFAEAARGLIFTARGPRPSTARIWDAASSLMTVSTSGMRCGSAASVG